MAKSSEKSTPSKSASKVRWALVAVAIVTLAVISGRAPEAGSSGGSSDDPPRCTVTVTADVLNVRAGPGTEHPTVDRLANDDVVDAEREISGGFRKLAEGRWVADEFVRASTGCTAP
jgi:hypothetical protein